MSIITDYKSAKDAGKVSLGDDSKPVHLVKAKGEDGETVNNQVHAFGPKSTGKIDPSTMQTEIKTVCLATLHPQYIDHLIEERRAKRKELEAEIEIIDQELAILPELKEDVEKVIKG